MRVRRGLVFWGLLLIPLGGIPLLARSGVLPTDAIAEAWRLWPLALVALGLLLIVGRTRASLAATVIVALVLGSVAGAVFAAGPPWIGNAANCGFVPSGPTLQTERSGTFGAVPTVRLDMRCGTLNVRPSTDATWQVRATSRGAAPVVTSSASRLELLAPDDTHRQDWTVQLPAGAVDRFELSANAASSTIALDGVQVGDLEASVNAGDFHLAIGSGSVATMNATINAGALHLTVGSSGARGSLTVNAGAIDLCVPDDANLRLTVTDQLTFGHNLAARGLTRPGGETWLRDGAGASVILRIDGNAAALTLNPEGGCR